MKRAFFGSLMPMSRRIAGTNAIRACKKAGTRSQGSQKTEWECAPILASGFLASGFFSCMRSRVVSISVLFAVVLLGCGKKVAVNNPALEPTAVLYPFEPIPVASYEGMGLAKHADLRIAQEMARTQAKSEVDEYMMSKLIELSQNLIDKPIRESLTKQIAGAGAVNADVQSLALFHEQQMNKARADNDAIRKKR